VVIPISARNFPVAWFAKANKWLILLAWWQLYALVYAANIVGMTDQSGQVLSWRAALIYSCAGWLSWVPLSAAIWAVTRRFPIEQGRYRVSIAIHSVLVVIVVVLRAAYVLCSNPWLHWYHQDFTLTVLLTDSLRNNFLTAWLVIGVAHAVLYAERGHDREVVIAKLQEKLTQARLDALSNQLNPHFLFNALNSVAELVHHDAAAADQMLVSLSALLRRSLATTGEHELPLAAELELLAHYLAIENIRLGPRLTVQLNVEPACRGALMPVLVLQTLMENALVHGIAKMPRGGRVDLTIMQRAAVLEITLDNDCAAVQASASAADAGHGLGLSNIKQRLHYLYGENAQLLAGPAQAVADDLTPHGRRFHVRLTLPFKRATSVQEQPH
jgi:hypothetical protein